MNYKNQDDMTILMFAFRYSLPPSTISKRSVLEQIIENRAKISKRWKLKMVEEAEENIKFVKGIREGKESRMETHDRESVENFIKVIGG